MSDFGEAVKLHLHHVYPQEFFVEFKRLGKIVDDYVMQLTATEHIGKDGLHLRGDYNGRWQDFFDEAEVSGRQLTKADAEAYLAEILTDLGLEDRLIGSLRTGRLAAEAEKTLSAYERLRPEARGSARGVASVGGIIFVVLSMGSVLYAVNKAKPGERLQAAERVGGEIAVQLVADTLISKVAGMGVAGTIGGLALWRQDDLTDTERETRRKWDAAYNFVALRVPSAKTIDHEVVQQAYDLLFNTKPIEIPPLLPERPPIPVPAPAPRFRRDDYPSPPPDHRGKAKALPGGGRKNYPLPPPVDPVYPSPPPIHGSRSPRDIPKNYPLPPPVDPAAQSVVLAAFVPPHPFPLPPHFPPITPLPLPPPQPFPNWNWATIPIPPPIQPPTPPQPFPSPGPITPPQPPQPYQGGNWGTPPQPPQPWNSGPAQPLNPGPAQPLNPGPVQPLNPGSVQPLNPGPAQVPQPGPGVGDGINWGTCPACAPPGWNWGN